MKWQIHTLLVVLTVTSSLFDEANSQEDGLSDLILPLLLDLIAGNGTNIPQEVTLEEWGRCRTAVENYAVHLAQGQPYALQMLDATSKLPDGLFNGNFFSPGSWDECIDVRLPSESVNGKGQYCIVKATQSARFDQNSSSGTIGDFLVPGVEIFVGTCIPSLCPLELFEASLSLALLEQGVAVRVDRCVTDDIEPLTSPQFFGVAFFSFFIFLVVLATAIDVANQHFNAHIPVKDNTVLKMLDCFSIYTNTKKFLIVTSNNPNEMTCLHGMRFITISWIILGHVYSEPPMYNSSINQAQNLTDWFTVGMMLILNSTMSVDTFFTISGFLVTYGLLKTLKKNGGKFPVLQFYLHRFLRLTPLYAAIVIASATIMPLVGDGPLYKQFYDIMGKPCLDRWWQTLLYIANMWDETWVCVAHAWYLSNDMQFYVVSPLFILPLFYKPVLGYVWMAVGLVASVAGPLYIMFSKDLWGSIVGQHFTPEYGYQFAMNFPLYYVKPWCRFAPYLVGICLGYIFYRIELKSGGKRGVSPLPPWAITLGWTVSTVACLLCIFGIAQYFPIDGDYMPLAPNAWYTALHRPAWAICIAWIIYACAFGRGGVANTILSWAPFAPLGRLTYAAYLAHLYFIGWFKGTRQAGEHIDLPMQVFTFVGYHVCGHIAGFLFSMAFEVPFLRLEKILMPWNNKKSGGTSKKVGKGESADGMK